MFQRLVRCFSLSKRNNKLNKSKGGIIRIFTALLFLLMLCLLYFFIHLSFLTGLFLSKNHSIFYQGLLDLDGEDTKFR